MRLKGKEVLVRGSEVLSFVENPLCVGDGPDRLGQGFPMPGDPDPVKPMTERGRLCSD